MSSNEAFEALRAACDALGDVDVSGWDDTLLAGHLPELSAALCSLDSEVSRVAEDVRARGFSVAEPAGEPVAAHGAGVIAEPAVGAGAEPGVESGPAVELVLRLAAPAAAPVGEAAAA